MTPARHDAALAATAAWWALLAMACAAGQASSASTTPTHETGAPGPAQVRFAPRPPGGSCGADAILEIECGVSEQGAPGERAPPPYAECPATSVAYAGYVPRLHLWRQHYATLQSALAFDAALTDQARVGPPSGAGFASACCYSACAILNVAAHPDAPASAFPTEACVTMPDDTSRVPAPAEPRCPAALAVPQDPAHHSPFAHTNPPRLDSPGAPSWAASQCCYTVANDAPAEARGAERLRGSVRGS